MHPTRPGLRTGCVVEFSPFALWGGFSTVRSGWMFGNRLPFQRGRSVAKGKSPLGTKETLRHYSDYAGNLCHPFGTRQHFQCIHRVATTGFFRLSRWRLPPSLEGSASSVVLFQDTSCLEDFDVTNQPGWPEKFRV
jgi:hypothetical protein